jgi:hypothetical protein
MRYTLPYAMVGVKVGDTRIDVFIGMVFVFLYLLKLCVPVLQHASSSRYLPWLVFLFLWVTYFGE